MHCYIYIYISYIYIYVYISLLHDRESAETLGLKQLSVNDNQS